MKRSLKRLQASYQGVKHQRANLPKAISMGMADPASDITLMNIPKDIPVN
jgi:hypothetical protein